MEPADHAVRHPSEPSARHEGVELDALLISDGTHLDETSLPCDSELAGSAGAGKT
jgi:hypothetical protein